MNGFTDSWLALREPVDRLARNAALVQTVRQFFGARQPLRIIDLGAGTGSNFRFMAPLLGHGQTWHLIDHDSSLLEQAGFRIQSWAQDNTVTMVSTNRGFDLSAEHFSARVDCQTVDLASQMQTLPFDQADLVTGAALLDLVSATWLSDLAGLCHQHRCAALFALTFDGSIKWQPGLPLDRHINLLLNRHQRQEKSFGMALGSSAVSALHREFGGLGFRLLQRHTPWTVGAEQLNLHRELLTGWTQALDEPIMALTIDQGKQLERWCDQRIALAGNVDTQLTVGHADQLALPQR